jgi:phospholipid/cholesterol/gamma-HCH transport system ATP-binding protein
VGVEVKVENLTKRFGKQTIWDDVSLTLPAGEISVLLGPSGTGKSVFLKHLVGLLKPNNGHIWIDGKDVCNVPEHQLYEIRKLFGVLFQDGALFGSQSLFDNIAFPLREHTKKSEGEIKRIVLEKMEMVGLMGAEDKLPGEISGGMRKRAGLARALVLDPEILLFDEPDSGLDPVRTAYLDQLIVDLNAVTGATCLIVTHNINTARTVPDNIGLLYRRHLAMFGPRMQLLTSDEEVVLQFLNGRKQGPIGMSEEKDAAELAAEEDENAGSPDLPMIEPQLLPTWPLVRRSMSSPHGSHCFLLESGARDRILVGARFGEDGIAPSDAKPAHPMTPEEARKQYLEEHPKGLLPSSTERMAEKPGHPAGQSTDRLPEPPNPFARPHGSATPSPVAPYGRPSPGPTAARPTPGPGAERPRPTPGPTPGPRLAGDRPRPSPAGREHDDDSNGHSAEEEGSRRTFGRFRAAFRGDRA